jgi:PTH1 family peptidyl-tRNA hydrolase
LSGAFLMMGLGNPGPKYAETRHNAGFWFLDQVVRKAGANLRERGRLSAETDRLKWNGVDCVFARPTIFMNHSGQAVRAVLDYYGIEPQRMLVAYDDLDLPPGTVRLKKGGGHGGHNGLRDIFRHVQDHGFLRLRIGIGHPGHKDAVTGYVLGRSPEQVRQVVDQAMKRAVDILPLVLEDRLQDAMNELHRSQRGD